LKIEIIFKILVGHPKKMKQLHLQTLYFAQPFFPRVFLVTLKNGLVTILKMD
jgi:hypothetical protein